jgi:hypothetical protein
MPGRSDAFSTNNIRSHLIAILFVPSVSELLIGRGIIDHLLGSGWLQILKDMVLSLHVKLERRDARWHSSNKGKSCQKL